MYDANKGEMAQTLVPRTLPANSPVSAHISLPYPIIKSPQREIAAWWGEATHSGVTHPTLTTNRRTRFQIIYALEIHNRNRKGNQDYIHLNIPFVWSCTLFLYNLLLKTLLSKMFILKRHNTR